MSEYKRLTEKVFTHDDGSSEYDCDASVRATNNRLGQLEDKIEEGKLVELPCLMESPYEEDVILVYSHTEDKKAIKCETFFTREDAEARLKELEEKGK